MSGDYLISSGLYCRCQIISILAFLRAIAEGPVCQVVELREHSDFREGL